MKRSLVKLSKIAGWIIVVLGVVHVIATVSLVKNVLSLGAGWSGTFLFMYVAAGMGCLVSGIMMIISSKKELREIEQANYIFLISAIFILLMGIGAPIAMRENPFGYITLAIGTFSIVVALLRLRG